LKVWKCKRSANNLSGFVWDPKGSMGSNNCHARVPKLFKRIINWISEAQLGTQCGTLEEHRKGCGQTRTVQRQFLKSFACGFSIIYEHFSPQEAVFLWDFYSLWFI
jgi:hypothetical protein